MRWPRLPCGPRAGPRAPVTAESRTPRMSRILDMPGPGRCVLAARQLSTGVWRRNVGGPFRVAGMAPAGAACLLVPAAGRQPGSLVELRRGTGGIVPCGAFGVLCRGPCGVRPEPGAGPAFRFVLVSVLRGPCPRLSVLSGGWEPAGTDIQRTASLRPNYSVLFEQVRGNMEVQAGAYCKTVLKNRQLSLRWFEPNTCHHMLKRPLGCGNAARRAVSFLSRSGGQASRS
jgi:hypothetical protein